MFNQFAYFFTIFTMCCIYIAKRLIQLRYHVQGIKNMVKRPEQIFIYQSSGAPNELIFLCKLKTSVLIFLAS